MEIRNADLSDLEAIYALDVSREEDKLGEILRKWVKEKKVYVAQQKGSLVGYSVLEYTFFFNGFISLLYVNQSARRQGVATALVKYFEKICETEKLFTSTNKSNLAMQRLLESLSYIPSGTVYNLDEGDPELFYFKQVSENST